MRKALVRPTREIPLNMSEEAKTYSLRPTLERPHVNWWGAAAFIIAGEGGIRLLASWSLHKLQEAFSPDITFAECYCGASLLFLLLFGKPAIIGCIRIYQRYAPESVRRKCTCKPADVKRYISRISGPMLDRIDIQIELPSLTYSEISSDNSEAETSDVIRQRVVEAREFAKKRTGDDKASCNARLDAAQIRKYCVADDEGRKLLKSAYESMGLSARGYDRIMKVSRTIADLAKSEIIRAEHIAEAVQLRSLDRKYWGEER